MQYDSWTSIPSMFFDMAGQCAGRPFLWAKEDGTWRPRNWEDVAEDVRRLAGGLVACQARAVFRAHRPAARLKGRERWPRQRESTIPAS